jgi:hypothetical protein
VPITSEDIVVAVTTTRGETEFVVLVLIVFILVTVPLGSFRGSFSSLT